MNTTMRRALRRLAGNAQLSRELARELHRQVAEGQGARRIYCSIEGEFYVAGKPADVRDLSICTRTPRDIAVLAENLGEAMPDGGDLQQVAAELAEWELQPHGD